jgi:hypothetical protein
MSKDSILLDSIKEFFAEKKNSDILEQLLIKKSGVSLRRIEKYVTQSNITYTTNGRPFVVHISYKASLDGYSKKYFDPFCRTERIQFDVNGYSLTTTLAQLNFVKWCISNDILHHMQNTSNQISTESNTHAV